MRLVETWLTDRMVFQDKINDAAILSWESHNPKNDCLTTETLDIIQQKRSARLDGNLSEYKNSVPAQHSWSRPMTLSLRSKQL